MGYYIETGTSRDKAKHIMEKHEALKCPSKEIARSCVGAKDMAVIVVMDNGLFEAAGFAYNMSEFDAFTSDDKPKQYLIMDRAKAKALTNYKYD